MQKWGEKRFARAMGLEDLKIIVDSMKLRRLSPGALKEGSLNAMVTQMKSGIAALESFYWQLRLADSIDDCFVTSDHPLVAWSPEDRGFDHRGTVMMFPLCWETCLLGRREAFALNFSGTTPQERESIRRTYFASAKKFVVSPRRLS